MNQDMFKQFEELSRRDIADKGWLARNRIMLLAYVRAHPKPASLMSRSIASSFWFRMVPAALIIFVMLVGATAMSAFLTYVQWHIVKAWCFWCLMSAGTVVLMDIIFLTMRLI